MRLKAPEMPPALPPNAYYHPNYTQTWNAERYEKLAADTLLLSVAVIVMVGSDGLLGPIVVAEFIQSSVNVMSDLWDTDEGMHDTHQVTKVFAVWGMAGGLIGQQLPIRNGFETGFSIGEILGDVPKVFKAGKSLSSGVSHFIHDGSLAERVEHWSAGPKIIRDTAEAKEEHEKSESKPSEQKEASPQPPSPSPARPAAPKPQPPSVPQGPVSKRLGSNGNDVHSGARGGGLIFDGGGGGGKYGGMA